MFNSIQNGVRMAKQKTVFISYRRTNASLALNIYQYLNAAGYDVFYDIESLRSGDWKRIILDNIRSRAHFLILLTPSAVQRFSEPDDIMRLEIETAIENKRNIVPLFMEDFKFPELQHYMTGNLSILPAYNGVPIPIRFFNFAMQELIEKRLAQDTKTIIHPASLQARRYADQQQREANVQAPVTQDCLSAQEYFERGLQSQNSGDIQDAIESYTRAINLKPDYSWALNNRAMLRHERIGDYHDALVDYNRAIDSDPSYALAYYNRAVLKKNYFKDYRSALADYNRAIDHDPNDAITYYKRGVLRQHQLNDFSGALDDYNRAIKLNGRYAFAYMNRGVVKKKLLRDYTGALVDFNHAIMLDPKYVKALLNRASLYYHQLKDCYSAKADWEVVLKIDTDNIVAKESLKKVNRKIGQC